MSEHVVRIGQLVVTDGQVDAIRKEVPWLGDRLTNREIAEVFGACVNVISRHALDFVFTKERVQ